MSILKEIFLQNKAFAHPTEGVWGLGCNPFSKEAVENLFNLKKRPKEKGVIILAGHIDQLDHFLSYAPSEAGAHIPKISINVIIPQKIIVDESGVLPTDGAVGFPKSSIKDSLAAEIFTPLFFNSDKRNAILI